MNRIFLFFLFAEQNTLPLPPTLPPNAQVVKIAQLTGAQTPFAEGTTTAPNGDVYFTDQNNQRIYKWDVTQKMLSVFLEPSGRSNGQYFDGKGNLLAAADERDPLWQITPDARHTVVASKFEEKYFNGPNDIWVRPDGGIYITDPYYRRAWWAEDPNHPATQPQDQRAVYYISPGHDSIRRVAVDFMMPNGQCGVRRQRPQDPLYCRTNRFLFSGYQCPGSQPGKINAQLFSLLTFHAPSRSNG